MLLPMVAYADAVEIDGIYYLVQSANTVAVASNPSKYAGEVVIPATVTYNDLEYNVTSIGGSAFSECTDLTSISIPTSVMSIDFFAFNGCTGLTSIMIPNSVTSIGESAFSGCSGLTSIVVEDGNTRYDSRNNCNAIIDKTNKKLIAGCKNTTIPNNITSIGSGAFYNCTGLTSITIPNNVTSVDNNAFDGCTNLTSVTISNNVQSINYRTFANCTSLPSITIPYKVVTISRSAFEGCSGLASVTIGNNVTSIRDDAFKDCSNLTSIAIPNKVKDIRSCAFQNCTSLTSVTLGTGIETINSYAFANCNHISDVYCYAENAPTTAIDAFEESNPDLITLYVPENSINAYKVLSPWDTFWDVVALNTINVSITSAKYATFCDNVVRNFSASGITVYAARATATGVILDEVVDDIVPANTGVILYSATAKNNVGIPLTTVPPSYNFSNNEMIGVNAETTVALNGIGTKKNYILANGSSGVGFYKAKDTGAKLAAHKAYLSTAVAAEGREFLGFDDEGTTAIGSTINTSKVDGQYYNLNGQRVAQPTKGLYIVNSKKIVIK